MPAPEFGAPETALEKTRRLLSIAFETGGQTPTYAAAAAAYDAAYADAAYDAADAAYAYADAAYAAYDAAYDAYAYADAAYDRACGLKPADAAADAAYRDFICQASAWMDEFERLWPIPYYRVCCKKAADAGEQVQFVEMIHHDGVSAFMCEASWYDRLLVIETDKADGEGEESRDARLERIEVTEAVK